MLAGFVHDLSHRVIFFRQIPVQVIHVVEVLSLSRIQLPPNVLLLYNTKTERVLICAVENIRPNVLARHFHRQIQIKFQLRLNIDVRHEFELERRLEVVADLFVDNEGD